LGEISFFVLIGSRPIVRRWLSANR